MNFLDYTHSVDRITVRIRFPVVPYRIFVLVVIVLFSSRVREDNVDSIVRLRVLHGFYWTSRFRFWSIRLRFVS